MLHWLSWKVRGGWWAMCLHRSHKLRLPCYRPMTYDGQCGKHNDSCFLACPDDVRGKHRR